MSIYDGLVQELHPVRAPIQQGCLSSDCSPPWDPIFLIEISFCLSIVIFLSLLLKFIQDPKEEKEKMLEPYEAYCQHSMTLKWK